MHCRCHLLCGYVEFVHWNKNTVPQYLTGLFCMRLSRPGVEMQMLLNCFGPVDHFIASVTTKFHFDEGGQRPAYI